MEPALRPGAKRSSSEIRKLRSRDAARCRRSQETEIFYKLAQELPLPRRISTNLDKAAVMRVTLSYLRLRHLLDKDADLQEDQMDQFYPQVLAGFVLLLNEEGDMIYLSENVSAHIGITQMELMGQSLYDFIHPCDQEELRDLLTTRSGTNKKNPLTERSFFLRMKNTLTSRGRTVNLKSATWKVLHCSGHVRPVGGSRVLNVLCEPIPHPSSVEFPLDSATLLTRHGLDLVFTHCEGRVLELLGYEPEHLIGQSVYHFYHAQDSEHMCKSISTLLAKGQVTTRPYRFLANGGGFVWVESQATVLFARDGKAEAIMCLTFVLSSVEQADVVLSLEQMNTGDVKAEAPREESPCPAPLSPSPVNGQDVSALSFSKVRTKADPEQEPEGPEELCSPALRKLLSPIFNPSPVLLTPPPSSPEPQSEPEQKEPSLTSLSGSECDEELMDTSGVERFFALWPETEQDTAQSVLMDEVDLDMLAPYISMDDDFQLSVLTAPEEAPGPDSRKRGLSFEPESVPEKKLRGLETMEEQLLRGRVLLSCLDEENQSEESLSKRGRSHLLTDKDPVLGGDQRTALMAELFLSGPAATYDLIHC